MHELRPRSVGGRHSKTNSAAVCGDGVRGCHGYAQRHEIAYEATERGAEGTLWFTAKTKAAAEWLRVKVGQRIESPVMQETEISA